MLQFDTHQVKQEQTIKWIQNYNNNIAYFMYTESNNNKPWYEFKITKAPSCSIKS